MEEEKDEFISPLLDLDSLYTSTDEMQESVVDKLEDADDSLEVLDILSDVHKKQRNNAQARRIKAILDKERSKDKEKQEPQPVEQSVKEPEQAPEVFARIEDPTETTQESSVDSFEPFSFDEISDNKEEETTKKEDDIPEANPEDLFGNFFDGKSGFGGISLDMLKGDNKMEAAEALSAQEFKDNGGVIDPNNYDAGGYINKEDYYTGKESSKENQKKKKQSYLTDEDGLFDPEQADDSQYVDGATPTSKQPAEVPVEDIIQEEPKYVIKKKKKKEYSGSSDDTDGKGVAWLAYILFFIPLIFAGKKSFVRHHANQGVGINIFDLLAGALIAIQFIPFGVEGELMDLVSHIGFGVGLVIEIVLAVARLVAIVTSLFGKRYRLPLFGRINFIKS